MDKELRTQPSLITTRSAEYVPCTFYIRLTTERHSPRRLVTRGLSHFRQNKWKDIYLVNSGQKVGELKWRVLKIKAKNYDNLLEAPTVTKEVCLETNRILLGKFQIDSVPETNAKVWLCPQDPDSLGNGSTDLLCSQHQHASAPGLQTGWEFDNSLIHPLPKSMEGWKPASRGSLPGPTSLEILTLSAGGFVMWTLIPLLTKATFFLFPCLSSLLTAHFAEVGSGRQRAHFWWHIWAGGCHAALSNSFS